MGKAMAGAIAGSSGNAQSNQGNATAGGDITSQLERLMKLKDGGALSDDEFLAAKKKLLGS